MLNLCSTCLFLHFSTCPSKGLCTPLLYRPDAISVVPGRSWMRQQTAEVTNLRTAAPPTKNNHSGVHVGVRDPRPCLRPGSALIIEEAARARKTPFCCIFFSRIHQKQNGHQSFPRLLLWIHCGKFSITDENALLQRTLCSFSGSAGCALALKWRSLLRANGVWIINCV